MRTDLSPGRSESDHNDEQTASIGFVRHGRTPWNAQRRTQGVSDIPLDDVGITQIIETSEMLRGTDWDLVVSSPLSRARESAEILALRLDVLLGEAVIDLGERDYGLAEGLTAAQVEARWPDWHVPGMEDAGDVGARGVAAVRTLLRRHPGCRLLVVSHGSLIRAVVRSLTGTELAEMSNGEVVLLTRSGLRWSVVIDADDRRV